LGIAGPILPGVTINADAAVQLHGTLTELTPACPEKVNVPFLQGMASMETEAELPKARLPLTGVKVTALPKSLFTDQLTVSPCALRVTLQ